MRAFTARECFNGFWLRPLSQDREGLHSVAVAGKGEDVIASDLPDWSIPFLASTPKLVCSYDIRFSTFLALDLGGTNLCV